MSCTQYVFYLSQGVPVMAIRNKMVLEGLDPNMLEWVLMLTSNSSLNLCGFVLWNFLMLTPPLVTAHLTPQCLTGEWEVQRIKMLLPPALTVSHLSVTDSFLQGPSPEDQRSSRTALRKRSRAWRGLTSGEMQTNVPGRIQPEWL